jgi:hypothetical protein
MIFVQDVVANLQITSIEMNIVRISTQSLVLLSKWFACSTITYCNIPEDKIQE